MLFQKGEYCKWETPSMARWHENLERWEKQQRLSEANILCESLEVGSSFLTGPGAQSGSTSAADEGRPKISSCGNGNVTRVAIAIDVMLRRHLHV